MGIPVLTWKGEVEAEGLFHDAEIIVDGVAGTGLRGPLEGVPLEMVRSINRRREAAPGEVPRGGCVVVSIDVPSGIGEGIPPEAPAVNADYTLAIEPFKVPLYVPALRPRAGRILPVRGIFPRGLLDKYRDAELLRWADRGPALSPLPPDSHKYSRGVVEIRAGSPGSAGAARIAAAGASAAGAGLVRLVVDDELYPVLAAGAGGVMVVPLSGVPAGAPGVLSPGRFKPHALLLGPGWGRDEVRRSLCREARKAEEGGLPLVLDADGIGLLDRDAVFHGRAILTPHAGEMEALTGIPRGRLLAEPALIAGAARRFNAAILFKSHVMVLSSPEGRLGFIDGMDPALAAGGSGDLLAGFCAALAARMRAAEERRGGPVFDPYAAAAAAGTLLAAASRRAGRVFYDPLRLAETAARLAGKAWLPRPPAGPN
jgi:NAD(P)H-hydrate epimerase